MRERDSLSPSLYIRLLYYDMKVDRLARPSLPHPPSPSSSLSLSSSFLSSTPFPLYVLSPAPLLPLGSASRDRDAAWYILVVGVRSTPFYSFRSLSTLDSPDTPTTTTTFYGLLIDPIYM